MPAPLVIGGPFLAASACGMSGFARIVFEDAAGREILRSGTPDLADASAVFTFVP